MSEVNLVLNRSKLQTVTVGLNEMKDLKERVQRVSKQVRDANKTPEEMFEDVGKMSMTDKERDLFLLAREAFFAGEIGRLKDGTLTKTEVMEMGRLVKERKEEKARAERIEAVLQNKPANFFILTDDSQLPRFLDRLREECMLQRKEWPDRWAKLGVKSLMAADYEGTGVDSYIDLSIGFSIWLPLLDEGYYLAYGHVEGIDEVNGVKIPAKYQHRGPQLTRSKVIRALKPYLEAETEGKSFHMGSARYDLHVAMKDGIDIRGLRWDSLDAMYLMNEHEESYALKKLVQKYGDRFGIDPTKVYTFEDLFGNCSPAPFNTELVGIYAILDVKYGWKLTEWQFNIMDKTNRLLDCYAEIDSRLPETDVMLTRQGFDIDLDRMKQLEQEFTAKLEQAKQDLFTAYNIDKKFLADMSWKLHGDKIKEWVQKQQKRIETHNERMEKQKAIIADCKAQGKTHLKKYKNAVEMLQKYKENPPVEAKPENSPHWIEEFMLTNNNHIGYLIYDFLGIPDATPRFKRGKTRATSKDVLESYFEDHPELEPLKTVSELEKLLGTYVRKIPNALEIDGKLHAVFNSTGTATGRYSSSAYSGRPVEVYEELLAEFGEGDAE
jgi:DNA polymerase I